MESAINQRAVGMLANATAYFTGGGIVDGVFDSAFDADMGGMIERMAPQFQVLTASLPALSHGMHVTINNNEYAIGGIQPDGVGITKLILTEL